MLTVSRSAWYDVFLASWLKYPSPMRPDILSVDIINKEFDPETGNLHATRLITVEGFVPGWLQGIVPGGTVLYAVEESTINVREKTYIMHTRNLNFTQVLNVTEKCTYTVSDENTDWTRLDQVAGAESCVWGLRSKIERFLVDSFKTNASKGRIVMENAICLVKENFAAAELHMEQNIQTWKDDLKDLSPSLTQLSQGFKNELADLTQPFASFPSSHFWDFPLGDEL